MNYSSIQDISQAMDSLRAAADSLGARAQVATEQLLPDGQATAYDSIWGSTIPTQSHSPLEEVMLSNDKLYVVLAVVLIIWVGIAIFLLRTDRQIDSLERQIEDGISDSDGHGHTS